MKRAFTITELLVAMGLLAAILAASGVIFSSAVDAKRTADATSEIALKLAVITDQLTADFKGLRKDCPLAIWFELDNGVRYDQILLFADGDYNSYHPPTITGNTARVYYGQANTVVFPARPIDETEENYQDSKILARRQHVYSSLATGGFPDIACIAEPEDDFTPENNDGFEYDGISLVEWKNVCRNIEYNNQFTTTCFSNSAGRAAIDIKAYETLHMLMSQGVGNFKIQLAYFAVSGWQWFPSTDPDGDGDNIDSDFTENEFGYYFNMPGGVVVDATIPPDGSNDWYMQAPLPRAFKFTFTLYDRIGIFPEGKTFTHIVYLDE